MCDKIAYLDLEVSATNHKIQNIGVLLDEFECEQVHLQNLKELFTSQKPDFICGHNFIEFDKAYLSNSSFNVFVQRVPIIDTLYLSLLLFPDKATHRLEKPYKHDIHRESPANSPLQDCKNTKNLFIYLNECFENLPQNLQDIFTLLLKDNAHFKGYFSYKALFNNQIKNKNILALIKEEFGFEKEHFDEFLHTPLEFAFVLSFIYALENRETRYFSTYILTNYPNCVKILKSLRSDNNVDIGSFAKDEYKDFNNFKEFQELKSQRLISQKDIIESALDGESFLAILPTGGGKTLTFWIPALIRAKQYKSLTVVISPLQALMQNHIESFKKNIKNQNFCVEAISGFLNPIERSGVFDKLTNGEVDILYLAPEALRSESIFKALQKRHIERFVIDEAHCFSMWGHNFRQDYRFIAQTIKDLEESKHKDKEKEKIAVSCFTATAKPEVIESINQYFKDNLGGIDLKEFIASSERENLSYKVIEVKDEEQKKEELWQILLKRQEELKGEENPTIIYIPQNATLCKKLWIWLKDKIDKSKLNLVVEPFYAKLDDDVRDGKKQGRKKAEILKAFINEDNKLNKNDRVDIIIATTAFGMGIDKPNITTIIHYQLSDSLESYIQESGRGARGKGKKAKCFILYDKKDIDKNFSQIRQSNLDFGEIKSLVRVLKNEYRKQKRNPIYISLKHLHKKLGKNEDEFDQTLIKTALLEIEEADIVKRKRVKTQIYATSLKIKEGKDKMDTVHKILDPQKESLKLKSNEELSSDDRAFLDLYRAMILIVQNIIQRSRENSVISFDELDEIVGSIGEKQIVQALKILEENEILGNENDILLFINSSKVRKKMENFFNFEKRFFEDIKEHIQREQNINLSKFNNENLKNLVAFSTSQNPLYMLQFIIKSWGYLLKLAKVQFKSDFKNLSLVTFSCKEIDKLDKAITSRKNIALFIIDEIAKKIAKEHKDGKSKGVELYVPISRIYDCLQEKEIKFSRNEFHSVLNMMNEVLDMDFDIRAGRLIYHQKECIEFNLEKLSERIPYRREHYDNSFKVFMEQKIANIHIFQAFLDNFVRNGKSGESEAKKFMRDYFSLTKKDFIKEYNIDEKFIKSPISKELLKKIIWDLNETQRQILEDKSNAIMIFAGPGSGKTKTLVHKIAHLLTKENKKSENFLMLAHSRVAVLEFRNRLYALLNEQAFGVKILTFHSFALSLLGERIKDDKELEGKITQATQALKNNEVNLPYIEMLVLDEYQDVNAESYEFIKAIYERMRGERQIIAVGDDDQLIMDFLGADKKFIEHFEQDFGTQDDGQKSFSKHTLSINYRSGGKIIDFINAFRKEFLPDSLKPENLTPSDKNKGFVSFTLHMHTLSLQAIAKQIQEIQVSISVKESISQKVAPSIAVLLRSNNEVLEMRYWLENLGIKAKYILEKEKFKAGNLIELWECLQHLKDGLDKDEAYNKICQKYEKSENIGIFKKAFRLFEKEYNNNLTHTNFEKFLQELSFDELETENLKYENKVIISTMHKAKGKEFDIVFVGVKKDFKFDEPAEKRLLYVAFSRAKQQLVIHTQRDDLKCLSHHFSEHKTCDTNEVAPQKKCYEMGLGDIWLDFRKPQDNLKVLHIVAGDICQVELRQKGDKKYIDILYEQKCVGSLDEDLRQTIHEKISQGYKLKQAKVKYVVKWQDKTQVLCEIYLEKT